MTESIGAVGFVGLGALGSEMALRLVAEGFDVMVFNRTAERTEPLVRAGASRASSLAELASSCDTVLGCLRDGAATEAVYLSDTGVLDHLRGGQIICEHGTFPPALARRIADEVGRRGATFLDVPVTGGRERARSGELAAMAGGDGDALDRIAEVLAAYTSSVTHVGGAGKGLGLKLINQLLVSIKNLVGTEAPLRGWWRCKTSSPRSSGAPARHRRSSRQRERGSPPPAMLAPAMPTLRSSVGHPTIEFRRRMTPVEPRVVVVGGGPVGLSAA